MPCVRTANQIRMMSATSKHSQSGENNHVCQCFSCACPALSETSAEFTENVSLAGIFLLILPSLVGGDATSFCLSTLIIDQILPGNASPGINSVSLTISMRYCNSSQILRNYPTNEIEGCKKNVG